MVQENQRKYPVEAVKNRRGYDTIIVAPGFSDNSDERTELFDDTKWRDIVAALFVKNGLAQKVVVGGGRIRDMKNSFADLMQSHLVRSLHLDQSIIEKEYFTRDTATQVAWISANRDRLGERVAIITDSAQAQHFASLLSGWHLQNIDLVAADDVAARLSLPMSEKYFELLTKILHESDYWKKWSKREKLLADFTKLVDHKGIIMGTLTSYRLRKAKN